MTPTITALAANTHPLIDFDSTVFIQLGLFIVVAWALTKYLFHPYLAVRTAREEGIEGAREKARALDDMAKAKVAEYEVAITRAKIKAGDDRNAIRVDAQKRERDIIVAARTATQKTLEESRTSIDAQAETARADLKTRADEIARVVVKKVIGREIA